MSTGENRQISVIMLAKIKVGIYIMMTKLHQIDDSVAVTIPPTRLKSLNMDKNSRVEVRLDKDFIQILPINSSEK